MFKFGNKNFDVKVLMLIKRRRESKRVNRKGETKITYVSLTTLLLFRKVLI